MVLRNSYLQYGSVAKFFHWLIFFLVVIQVLLGFFWDATGDLKAKVINSHKLLGLTILFFITLRWLWMITNPKPVLGAATPGERLIEHIVHALLYVCLFTMPLTGWALTTAIGKPPHIFDHQIAMPGIPLNKPFAEIMLGIHSLLAGILVGLITIHVIAALKHHFINKDNVLKRMLPGKWL